MTRTHTKQELLEAIATERKRLEAKLAGLTPDEMTCPGCMGEWSAKDILAHLVDWEQRFVAWYNAGLRGEVPHTPAPGLTWRQLPILNRQGFEHHRNEPLEQVLADFHASHEQIVGLVEAMPEEEIYTPGRYAWTGKYSLAAWIEANTSSHYNWARTQLRVTKIRKDRAVQASL